MRAYRFVLAVASLVVLVGFACADIPVHCLWEQVHGTWRFHLGPGGNDNTVNCSLSFREASYVDITLNEPDVATDSAGNVGMWTMIYDQGFEVQINKQKYFAFSYYTQDSSGNVTSYCARTFPGWYHNDDGSNWGCYYGEKLGASEGDISSEAAAEDAVAPAEDAVYRADFDFIRRINKAQNTWVAADYKEYRSQRIADLQRRGGHTRHSPLAEAVPKQRKAGAHFAAPAKLHGTGDDLPAAFDWRNVSGVNFVSPVRNQGHCGSCYSFASTALLEARVRILTNNRDQPVLAPQDVVSCSQYSQGCSGGFNYLIAGKYAEDFGIVLEECFPYAAMNEPCSMRCANSKRYFSTDYYYVGGYYGATTVDNMMREIYEHGPIAVSFQVLPDFHNYKGGVYQHTSVSLSTFNPFQVVSHAVLAVGWGVTDDNVPYWIVKNSWGDQWGENGYFRILRGTDECNIESIAVAATPVLDK